MKNRNYFFRTGLAVMLTGFFLITGFHDILAQDTARGDSTVLKTEEPIQHLTRQKLSGKYMYQTPHGYIKMRIHGNSYRRRGYTYFGWCIDKGKCEIRNDTIILTEKWSRDHPFSKRDRDTTVYRLKLVMVGKDLYYISAENEHEVRNGHYTTKHAWRKQRRARRNLQRRIQERT